MAKTTIDVLVANMVRPNVHDLIMFKHYKDIDRHQVIKLLIRVKNLYDARAEVVDILKLVTEVEQTLKPGFTLWRIL